MKRYFSLVTALSLSLGLGLGLSTTLAWSQDKVVIGSKSFTEGFLLSELAAQSIERDSTLPVDRKLGLGSTGILFEALKTGAIDVYPDYTGTLAETLLHNADMQSIEQIRQALKPLGLTISDTLGFNNTYALAVKSSYAKKYHLHSMSDLQKISPGVRAAFSYEFMDRPDGYPGMVRRYQFQFTPNAVLRMEHSLVYKALQEDAVDLIEVYSTDANINKFGLQLLTDDLHYFPNYQAVWVARDAFVRQHPQAWNILRQREGSITAAQMRNLNAAVDIDKIRIADAVRGYLNRQQPAGSVTTSEARPSESESATQEILRRTQEHLWLVGIALLFSLFVGIPLGIMATRFRIAGQIILLSSALVQTIPTLALLCFLIPVFGVGLKPALVALCLYSLLPVVLNTFTGVSTVDQKMIENASAFGLSRWQILFHIELPMSSPVILAGLKTATIVSVGTATLAALIGAGGYGALIISGLSLNNTTIILEGAIPAALMALLAHALFALLDNLLIPAGLKKAARTPGT